MCEEFSVVMDQRGVIYVGVDALENYGELVVRKPREELKEKHSHTQIAEHFGLSEALEGVAKLEFQVNDNFKLVVDYKPEWFTGWHEKEAQGFGELLSLKCKTDPWFWWRLRAGNGNLVFKDGIISEVSVGGWLDLSGTGITELPAGMTVGGSLDLSGTQITALPDGLTVGGWLYLSRTGITELPADLKVDGEIYR